MLDIQYGYPHAHDIVVYVMRKQNIPGIMNKQINIERGQSGTYLRLTRASSGPRVSVAKTYRDETKRKCEYFGQITVSFLSSRIQETEAKFLSAAEARVECGGVNGY